MSGGSIVRVDLPVNLGQTVSRGHDSELLTKLLTEPLRRVLCFDEAKKLLALTTVERCVVHSTSGAVEHIDLLAQSEIGLPSRASEVLPLLHASTAGEVSYAEGRLKINTFQLQVKRASPMTSIIHVPHEPCYMAALQLIKDGRTAFVHCSIEAGKVNTVAPVPLAVLETELEMLRLEKMLNEDGIPVLQGRGIGGQINDDGGVHLESPLKYSSTKGTPLPGSVLFIGTTRGRRFSWRPQPAAPDTVDAAHRTPHHEFDPMEGNDLGFERSSTGNDDEFVFDSELPRQHKYLDHHQNTSFFQAKKKAVMIVDTRRRAVCLLSLPEALVGLSKKHVPVSGRQTVSLRKMRETLARLQASGGSLRTTGADGSIEIRAADLQDNAITPMSVAKDEPLYWLCRRVQRQHQTINLGLAIIRFSLPHAEVERGAYRFDCVALQRLLKAVASEEGDKTNITSHADDSSLVRFEYGLVEHHACAAFYRSPFLLFAKLQRALLWEKRSRRLTALSIPSAIRALAMLKTGVKDPLETLVALPMEQQLADFACDRLASAMSVGMVENNGVLRIYGGELPRGESLPLHYESEPWMELIPNALSDHRDGLALVCLDESHGEGKQQPAVASPRVPKAAAKPSEDAAALQIPESELEVLLGECRWTIHGEPTVQFRGGIQWIEEKFTDDPQLKQTMRLGSGETFHNNKKREPETKRIWVIRQTSRTPGQPGPPVPSSVEQAA